MRHKDVTYQHHHKQKRERPPCSLIFKAKSHAGTINKTLFTRLSIPVYNANMHGQTLCYLVTDQICIHLHLLMDEHD